MILAALIPGRRLLAGAACTLLATAAVAAAAATAAAASTAATSAAEPNVLRATLPNGLRVIIVRNTLAPVVATSVNYLVGSDEAAPGFPGMAHAQEHMMFRGSPGLSAEQLANIGAVMGGDFNANTRESITQYLFTVPAEDIDVALHIEALRMQGVLDTTQGWDQERGAIEQEVAQDRSNPGYVLYAKIRSIMFGGTVYAHDALGTRESFDKTTAAMLKSFHDAWYAPNNADSDHRRRRRARADAARGTGIIRRHQTQAVAAAAGTAAAPGAGAVLQRQHRPAGRHADDRDAHAGARQSGFSGARGARGCSQQSPFRSLWPGAARQGDRGGIFPRSAAARRSCICRLIVHRRKRSQGAGGRGSNNSEESRAAMA